MYLNSTTVGKTELFVPSRQVLLFLRGIDGHITAFLFDGSNNLFFGSGMEMVASLAK